MRGQGIRVKLGSSCLAGGGGQLLPGHASSPWVAALHGTLGPPCCCLASVPLACCMVAACADDLQELLSHIDADSDLEAFTQTAASSVHRWGSGAGKGWARAGHSLCQ